MSFDDLLGALVRCNLCLCGAHVEVVVLVHVMVRIICPLLGTLSEVAKGLRLVLPQGCALS